MKYTNRFIPILLFVLIQNFANAQLIFDTINQFMAGPGTKVLLVNEVTKPWSIKIMEVDLLNPYISLESVKAKDRIEGLEKTSEMARRKSTSGHNVIGAVNGDFYSGDGTPINTQIINGEILRAPISRSTIGFSETNQPIIQLVNFTGTLSVKNSSFPINSVNGTRSENQLILYNSFKGTSTSTNNYGSEWICTPLTQNIVNDTVWVKAMQLYENTGNTALTVGTFVLSGHGSAATFLTQQISQGDTLALVLNLGDPKIKLKNLIGGFPQIIKNGVNFVDEGFAIENGPSHTYERHPRTAAGFNADNTKLYLITVDGRQEQSIGMTLNDLADYMLTLGIHQGINFDGGGSTTMIANNKIVNSPSDISGERNVANALMVVSSAPIGAIQRIQIQPNLLKIRYGAQQQITLSAYDAYNNPLPYDTNNVKWNLTNNLGYLDGSGIFFANGGVSSGYIYAQYQNFHDSILVNILPIEELTILPMEITTDSILLVDFKAITHNINTTAFEIDPTLLEWSINDPQIGTITELGRFKGAQSGTTQVVVKKDGVQAEAKVNVEIFTETQLLDNFDLESWNITSSFFDSLNVSIENNAITEGTGAYKIDYQFTYANRTPYFTLHKTIPVPGIPDSIWTDGKFDNRQYRLSYNLSTNSNVNNFTFSDFVNNNHFQAIGASLNTKPVTDYPYVLKEFKVEIWKNETYELGKLYTGTIYIDNLRVSYPGHTSVVVSNHPQIDEKLRIHIYPNPAGETVYLNLETNILSDTNIETYTIDGKKVPLNFEKVADNTLAANVTRLKRGVYLIKVHQKSTLISKQLIIN